MALSIYHIQKPHTHCFSGCPIVFSFVCGPYGIIEQQQDVRFAVRVEKEVSAYSDLWTECRSQLIAPDNSGKITFDIASIADAYLKYHTPDLRIEFITATPMQHARFRIVVTLNVDGVQVGNALTTDEVMVYKGGLAYEHYHPSSFFVNRIAAELNPLHYYTAKEYVQEKDKKFMTFLMHFLANDPKVQVEWFTSNGFEGTHDITLAEPFSGILWGMYIAPIGFNDIKKYLVAHGVDQADFLPFVTHYKVSVFYAGLVGENTLIASQTFYIDHRTYYNTTQLFYTNSMGGFDDIAILGEIDTGAEYETQLAKQVTPPGGLLNNVLQAQDLSWNSETEKFQGSTRFIPKDKVNRLRDLLLSKNVYQLKDGKLIPVLINKKSVKFYNSKDSLFSIQFDWQHAFSNEYYTPPGVIAEDDTCPALVSFEAVQISREQMQIMWSAPMPYDMIEVIIDNGTPEDLITEVLSGNSGSVVIEFPNDAVYPATIDVTVKGRVICNPHSSPADMGPQTTIVVVAAGNTPPTAVDDLFALQAGFTTAQVLPGSVMANDYDLDGDAFEVDPDSGATTAGGTFAIDATGEVTYTPPAANYNGIDSFQYTIFDSAEPGLTSTATVRIHVGNINLGDGTYVKMVERNHREKSSPSQFQAFGDFWLTFWQDPAATIPKDVSGLGLSINVKRKFYHWNITWVFDHDEDYVHPGVGTEVFHFSGRYLLIYYMLGNQTGGQKCEFLVEPGTGYIPI